MSKTLVEVSTSVLRKLGRLPAGQTATTGQLQQISDSYDGVYDQLLNDSLTNWAKTDDIPDFAVLPIKVLILGDVANDFGVPDEWSQEKRTMRKELRDQIGSDYVSTVTKFENI